MNSSSSKTLALLMIGLLVPASLLVSCGGRVDDDGGVAAATGPFTGYYAGVDASSPAALRSTLHETIDDHQWFPYTSTAIDTWDILDEADEDPNNPNNILDIYQNGSYPKAGGGNDNYNREHAWPKSYGFPNDGMSNYPHNDCHHLFLAYDSYNSSRGNDPYGQCDASCAEKPTLYNNEQGGGSGTYPGNSNWRKTGVWETWIGRRGDVARALLYMDVRYEGGTHGETGVPEPDLILTDNPDLIVTSASNESVAYMGMLSTLLAWNVEDPVSDDERARNEVVYGYQGNRNPFVDHPEWVDCVFSGICGGGCTGDEDCDDGLFCNGAETCNAGACTAGADPCPGEQCDEATDSCVPLVCNGDGVCDTLAGEDCSNCAADCVTGGSASCGNGVCEAADGEDCVSCPADCNGKQGGKPAGRFCCGDGDGEGAVSCGDSRCTESGFACTDQPSVSACCGDAVCEGSESSANCEYDCGPAPYCGDGSCNGSEDSCSCAGDCGAPPASELSCSDGQDDDCDGDVDCDDADCAAACQCSSAGTSCTADAECCSGSCKGKPGSKTCK